MEGGASEGGAATARGAAAHVDPHVVLVVGDVGEGGDQVAEGRPPRVAGEDLGGADGARRLLLGEQHVAAQPLLGRGLDDLQHDVDGAHAWRHLLDKVLEPAQLHARVHAAQRVGLRLRGHRLRGGAAHGGRGGTEGDLATTALQLIMYSLLYDI